ncbi:MAG: hypothetical protein WBS54_07330 [Acidobacteriota bacterium]
MNKRWFLATGLALILLSNSVANRACATCGCTLNSDWASQGFAFGKGFHFDLRLDYFDQDQLRSGTGRVASSHIRFPSDREIQLQTINRNLTLDLGYSPDPNWQFDLLLPTYDRTHSTLAAGDTAPSYSRSAGIGDAQVQARWQGLLRDHSLGLQFGVKLPTGRFHDLFQSGPQAGQPLDRGLQLGTGTTDVLLGLYKFGSMGASWGYFAQASVQVALASREGFRPGDLLNASAGLRYSASERVTPQIQLNVVAQKPERGINADTQNSGASAAYLSPGFSVRAGQGLYLFAFVQLPVYQRVDGYQVMPRSLFTAGLHYRF